MKPFARSMWCFTLPERTRSTAANPLERHFRDVHVVVQHNAAFAVHYESAGKVLLGLRPTDPGWQ